MPDQEPMFLLRQDWYTQHAKLLMIAVTDSNAAKVTTPDTSNSTIPSLPSSPLATPNRVHSAPTLCQGPTLTITLASQLKSVLEALSSSLSVFLPVLFAAAGWRENSISPLLKDTQLTPRLMSFTNSNHSWRSLSGKSKLQKSPNGRSRPLHTANHSSNTTVDNHSMVSTSLHHRCTGNQSPPTLSQAHHLQQFTNISQMAPFANSSDLLFIKSRKFD